MCHSRTPKSFAWLHGLVPASGMPCCNRKHGRMPSPPFSLPRHHLACLGHTRSVLQSLAVYCDHNQCCTRTAAWAWACCSVRLSLRSACITRALATLCCDSCVAFPSSNRLLPARPLGSMLQRLETAPAQAAAQEKHGKASMSCAQRPLASLSTACQASQFSGTSSKKEDLVTKVQSQPQLLNPLHLPKQDMFLCSSDFVTYYVKGVAQSAVQDKPPCAGRRTRPMTCWRAGVSTHA